MSRRFLRVFIPLIVVPCLVALLTWFTLRCLQGWWVFAGINERRPGIVFVAAMIGLAAVVIGEFFAYRRQIAVRTLAKRMSLFFSAESDPSLEMQIKHLVIGKGSQFNVIVENVIHGHYRGMQLVMADSLFVFDRGEDTDREEKTIWFFNEMVALYPRFQILPRTGANAGKSKNEGDLSHFPAFSKIYAVLSDQQDAVQQILNSEFCGYFRSRHNWQVHADGSRIAFVRDGKLAVDDWQMYLRDAIGAVKLLDTSLEELLGRQMPIENRTGRDTETLPSDGVRARSWGADTEARGEIDREAKPIAGRRNSLIDQAAHVENVTPGAAEVLGFERKETVGAFAAIESLVDSASQKALRYHEISDFMQHLPPRKIPRLLWNENVPRVPFVFWFMSFPMIVFGLVTIMWGMLHAGGMIIAGHEFLLVLGAVNLLPVCAMWGGFYRRRRVYLQILREGTLATATVRSRYSTVDYGIEDWLTCKHTVDVQFLAGEESVNGKATVKGMQMKTLQRCLDDGTPLCVLYLKDRPEAFRLSTQLASRRFSE